jgi:hypothetical protein
MENNDRKLRELLVRFLRGETHMSLTEAVSDFPISEINTNPPKVKYSIWQLLEHIRFTQRDIINFIIDPEYAAPNWPDDYWPGNGMTADANMWQATIGSYQQDLQALEAIVLDTEVDLAEKIPWGDGQTMIEELIKISDHTSYHLGELGILRQVMSNWPENRT